MTATELQQVDVGAWVDPAAVIGVRPAGNDSHGRPRSTLALSSGGEMMVFGTPFEVVSALVTGKRVPDRTRNGKIEQPDGTYDWPTQTHPAAP